MTQFICDSRGVHEVQAATGRNPPEWFVDAFMGRPSESGLRVTAGDIISHAPIWQGINIIAGDCAMLPKMLKRKLKEGGSKDDETHTAYRLVAQIANPLMLSITFWETLIMWAIVHGNGIAEIARDSTGRPMPADQGGMTPLLPDATEPWYDDNGRLWIKTRVQLNGTRETRLINPVDTLHIKGLAADGIWGLSLRQVAQDTIGYGLALRKHGNTTFKNRARPDIIVNHPGRLSDDAAKHLRESWNALHQGLDNVARMAILEEGATAMPFGQNNEDAQWIEAQKFDIDNVSRLLNIPPHMLGSMDSATFTNIEEQGRNYINRTLNRWLSKIVWECWRRLLTRLERERFFFSVNVDMLLKGTLKDRAAAYNQLIASMILSPNEVREEEGWNPREGGDQFVNPNTTSPFEPSQPEETDEDESSDEMSARLSALEQTNARLLADRLRAVVHNEDSEVHRAASNERNFVSWLDTFYKEQWRERLSELVDVDIAASYCDQRYCHWLNISGSVHSTGQLADSVAKGRADAKDRSAELLNLQINPAHNGTLVGG